MDCADTSQTGSRETGQESGRDEGQGVPRGYQEGVMWQQRSGRRRGAVSRMMSLREIEEDLCV